MGANKTQPTDADVGAFLASVEPPERRAEAERLVALMAEVTGERPRMWGGSMLGFGERHYRYASGREGDTFRIGFAARKAQLVLYLTDTIADDADLLAQLGPHTTGVGCLNVKRLDRLDPARLAELLARAWRRRAEESAVE